MNWFVSLLLCNFHILLALGSNIASSKCRIPTKQYVPASVFDAGENLSYDDCGLWSNAYEEFAPWSVSIVRWDGRADCPGILISPTTIISEGCGDDYEDYKDQKVIYNAHLGECYRQTTNDDSCTNHGNGLKKTIINATKLSTTAFNSNPLHLWKFEKINNFRPTNFIRPVCLFNTDASRDFDTSQIYTSMYHPRGSDRSAQIVQVKECLGNMINSEECSRLDQVICVHFEEEQKQNVLYNVNNERYFLRGIFHYSYKPDYTLFFDVLPLIREVILQSARDLYLLPAVPFVKERVAFYNGMSFPGCGITHQHGRRRRSNDDISEAGTFIFNGEKSPQQSAPWHASLSLMAGKREICGGSLISQRAVLTAAHCLRGNPNPEQIIVTLGLYDRKYRQDRSIQTKHAKAYLIHPNYKSPTDETKYYETYENDVAIILFWDNFQITSSVRPVCLWNSDYHLSTIVNKHGLVHGWGLDEHYTQPDILQRASLPVRTYWDCYLAYKDFFSLHLKPGVTFCAGQNGTSACNGDSGGGFVMEKDQKWFIRGIVSLGIVKSVYTGGGDVTRVCDKMYPSLYTDLANCMQWIAQNVPDINSYVVT